MIKNFKLKNGAIGSTVGHDSHNMIVVGDNDEDILANKGIRNSGGGLTMVSKGRVLKSLPLEIAGIMTSRPIEETNSILKEMIAYPIMKKGK